MDQDTIKDFIESITPGNWVVLTEYEMLRRRFENNLKKLDADPPCRLYISLFVENREDKYRMGSSSGHIKEYSGFSSCELFLYPHFIEDFSWQGTVIHELAHIAVLRWVNFRFSRKKPFSFTEASHGPVFEKARLRILERARNILGENFDEIEMELSEEFFFD